MSDLLLTLDLEEPRIDPAKPLLIVDVDEVLALFFLGFGRFLKSRGYNLRADRFALFENIFREGETEHLDIETGRDLVEEFYGSGFEDADAAPHAADSLHNLSQAGASVVILTNAPAHVRVARARWLANHDMDYPLVFNLGAKGGAVAALASRSEKTVAFVDDQLANLESTAKIAPWVNRFQLVADERLRPIAPTAPERHRRIDQWPQLQEALRETLGLGQT